MNPHHVAIGVNGKRSLVPAIEVHGRHVITTGRWIKTAMVHDEGWLDRPVEDPQSYIDRLTNHHGQAFAADIFTFAQRPPDVTPHYAFPMQWDNVAAIRLDDPTAWWEALPQETRKNVRRSAKRGVSVGTTTLNDDLIRGIVSINNESPMRQGKPFAHYGKDFERVKQDYSSFADRSEFVVAHFQGELIGFVQLVYMGTLASILGILMKASHQDKRPANALLERAVTHCAAAGISHLVYGKYSYGNKRTDNPLTEFKRRNGFEKIDIPRYYVPLTVKGRISIAFQLHRGLLELLPGSVISPLLAARRIWYRSTAIRRPV